MLGRSRFVQEAIASDGVTYNVYADPKGASRPWELDLLPLILPADEWRAIAAAVAQRARLLDAVLADLYGPQQLLAEGLIPPALVFGQRSFLWPAQGIAPPGGVFMHVYAADLARSPDGRWWVLADRTRGPSGAGYALQNRMTLSRAFPDAFRELQVEQLAPFFRELQDSLYRLSPTRGEAPLAVLLTPGPFNETYFEHSFLARYLGFPLVEGQDLIVRGDCVYLKTLRGLRRVHAILRRLDDDFCDPVELRADSALGIPGLLHVIRAGNVLIANALGSAVLETGAFAGFYPALSERLFGEKLAMPSIATWWCGEAPALEYVVSHLDELVIKPAYPSMQMEPVFGHTLDAAGARAPRRSHEPPAPRVRRAGMGAPLARADVGRTRTAASCRGPRALRVFAVATPNGYTVMPGALTRVAPHEGDVVSMQSGGSSKDTWVLAGRPGHARPAATGRGSASRTSRRAPSTSPRASARTSSGWAATPSAARASRAFSARRSCASPTPRRSRSPRSARSIKVSERLELLRTPKSEAAELAARETRRDADRRRDRDELRRRRRRPDGAGRPRRERAPPPFLREPGARAHVDGQLARLQSPSAAASRPEGDASAPRSRRSTR